MVIVATVEVAGTVEVVVIVVTVENAIGGSREGGAGDGGDGEGW